MILGLYVALLDAVGGGAGIPRVLLRGLEARVHGEQAQLLADLPHDRATVVLPVVWRELAGEYPSKLVVGKAYSCTGTRPSCSDHVATAIAVT